MFGSDLEEKVREHILDVKDFPKEGIIYKDITPILKNQTLINDIVSSIEQYYKTSDCDAIIAAESRGFFMGLLLANKLNIPFIPVRKPGKLPRDVEKIEFDLEYGQDALEIHKGDIKKGWRVLIHDDVLATGGTAVATANLAKSQGAEIIGFSFIAELLDLKGKLMLEKYSKAVHSVVKYE